MTATVVLGGALDADTLVAIADGAPIALDSAALAAVARNRRVLEGLLASGTPMYMIVQYSAAALVSELRARSHPVSVDSIATSDKQEDHVSIGMTAALMALGSVDRVERIVAIELLCACQALDCDRGAPAPAVAAVHAAVRERVPMLIEDRPPAPDIAALHALVRERGLQLPHPEPHDRLAA